MVNAEGGPLKMTLSFGMLIVDQSWFSLVVWGSQVALVIAVLMLLVIWWIEWRNGRIW